MRVLTIKMNAGIISTSVSNTIGTRSFTIALDNFILSPSMFFNTYIKYYKRRIITIRKDFFVPNFWTHQRFCTKNNSLKKGVEEAVFI